MPIIVCLPIPATSTPSLDCHSKHFVEKKLMQHHYMADISDVCCACWQRGKGECHSSGQNRRKKKTVPVTDAILVFGKVEWMSFNQCNYNYLRCCACPAAAAIVAFIIQSNKHTKVWWRQTNTTNIYWHTTIGHGNYKVDEMLPFVPTNVSVHWKAHWLDYE